MILKLNMLNQASPLNTTKLTLYGNNNYVQKSPLVNWTLEEIV